MIPSSRPMKAGDVLMCTSDGYPEPSYTWTDSQGVVVSTSANITVTNSSFVLNCTATGNLRDDCSASIVADSAGMIQYHSTIMIRPVAKGSCGSETHNCKNTNTYCSEH